MTDVDKFIQDLEEGGEAEPGRFTLDRDQAREKMRQFQLSDPHLYVLELVQAAVAKGATRLQFDIDADDLHLRFDGSPFDWQDLQELYGALFEGAQASAAIRARQELALGINAALALDPRRITVTSGRVSMEVRPGREDRLEQAPVESDPIAGTHVHVKRRIRPGLVVSFIKKLRGALPEAIALRRRCLYCPVEVMLNGEPLSRGLPLEGALAQVDIGTRDQPLHGVAGILPAGVRAGARAPAKRKGEAGRRAGTHLLKDGVLIITLPLHEDHTPEGEARRFVVVLDGDALRKDVSQTDIVKNDAFESVPRVTRRALLDILVTLLQEDPGQAWVQNWVDHALHTVPRKEWRAHPGWERLAAAVTFDEARGEASSEGEGEPVDLATLIRRYDHEDRVPYAKRRYAHLAPEPDRPVLLTDEPKRAGMLFSAPLRCVDSSLDNAQRVRVGYLQWRSRPLSALSPDPVLASVPVVPLSGGDAASAIRGEVGVQDLERSHSSLVLAKDEHLLCTLEVPLPVSGLHVTLNAPFTPTPYHDGAEPDEQLVEALLTLSAALPGVLKALAHRPTNRPDPALRRFLLRALCYSSLEALGVAVLRAVGFVEEDARAHEERWQQKLAAVAEGGVETALDALEETPLFETFSGQLLTMRQIREHVDTQGVIFYATLPPANLTRLRAPLLKPGGYERTLLETVLGEQTFRPYDAAEDPSFFELTPAAPDEALELSDLYQEPLTGEGITGVVALPGPATPPAFLPEGRTAARMLILRQGRLLGHRDFPTLAGPLCGVAESAAVSPGPTGRGVRNDLALLRVGEAARAAAVRLINRACAEHDALTPVARQAVDELVGQAELDLKACPEVDQASLATVLAKSS